MKPHFSFLLLAGLVLTASHCRAASEASTPNPIVPAAVLPASKERGSFFWCEFGNDSVQAFGYYRLRIKSRAASDGHWAARFYDVKGEELVADDHDRIFASTVRGKQVVGNILERYLAFVRPADALSGGASTRAAS